MYSSNKLNTPFVRQEEEKKKASFVGLRACVVLKGVWIFVSSTFARNYEGKAEDRTVVVRKQQLSHVEEVPRTNKQTTKHNTSVLLRGRDVENSQEFLFPSTALSAAKSRSDCGPRMSAIHNQCQS